MTATHCSADVPAPQKPDRFTPRPVPRSLVMPRGDTALDRAFRARTTPDVDLGHPDHPRRWMRVTHAQWRGCRRQLRDAIAALRRHRANAGHDPAGHRVEIALLDLRAAYWADRAATARLAAAIATFKAADAHQILGDIPRAPRPVARRRGPDHRTDPPPTGPTGAARSSVDYRPRVSSHGRRRRDADSRQRGIPAARRSASGAAAFDPQAARRRP